MMILDEETSKRLFESFRYVGECLGELFVALCVYVGFLLLGGVENG